MKQNNEERFAIWESLSDKFSVVEFNQKCRENSIEEMHPQDFALKVGLLLCGHSAYPDMGMVDAHIQYVIDNPRLTATVVSTPTDGTASCGNCGGGAVR